MTERRHTSAMGPSPELPEHDGELASKAATPRAEVRRLLLRRGLPLVVTGVCLYLLLPSLVAVLGSWHSLAHLAWPFAVLCLASESASYACLWELDRIALRAHRWFAVIAAQLSANAVGRILPGGGATFAAFAASMLKRAGFNPGRAVTALGTSSTLQLATTFALPVLALPAILAGAPISRSLVTAAYLGLVVVLMLAATGTAAFASDAPLELAGRAIQRLANATVRRHRTIGGLDASLLQQRDIMRETLRERWKAAALAAAGNTGFDYLALLCALRAAGADPRPSLVLLAYVAAALVALVPLTPGGLGFVEAGLVGMLTLAGVPAHEALAATLLYRLVSFWLPLPAGGLAYVLFQRRYGRVHQPQKRSTLRPK